MVLLIVITIILLFGSICAWPDGAPCKRSVVDSMNPLQAEEHAGGLQVIPNLFHRLLLGKYWCSK